MVQNVRAVEKRDGRTKSRQKAEGVPSPVPFHLSVSLLMRTRKESE